MLLDIDKEYLQTNLRRNRVVLFLGAGFSKEAENFAGEQVPDARGLAIKLWNNLGYLGDYDGTELRYLYDAARKRNGDQSVRILLRDLLTVSKYPDWYKFVSGWYWRRIYTTNIDNLVETTFAGTPSAPKLEQIIPPDEFVDRDAFLRKIQYVKFHGSAANLDKPIVFSPIEYGRRASLHDTWYDHFLRDYWTYPTILVGTELNEPLFWQYLAARQERMRGAPESRPKSFLVSPGISKARIEALSTYNIEPVDGKADEFFKWLAQLPDFKAPREAILREVDPTLEEIIVLEKSGASRVQVQAAESFFSTFDQVRVLEPAPSARRDFLLGVHPTWDDIAKGFDADREINKTLADALRSVYTKVVDDVPIVVFHGTAGSGKSSTAMRVAYTLVQEGVPVYFASGRNRPDPGPICSHLRLIATRPFLVFDNAGPDLYPISDLKKAAQELPLKPVILISLRSNQWFQKRHVFQDFNQVLDIEIPNLSPYDITQILTVLEREGLLGALLTLSMDARFQVFNEKARKQILIAMREATKGRAFDEILRDEFNGIAPKEARLLFMVAAIPSMRHYHITFGQMVSALELPPSETGALLRQALSGIVLSHPRQTEHFAVRHPVIAEYIATSVANPELLADAYIRYLQVIGHEINFEREGKTSRIFRIYRDLINHENLHDSIPRHPDLCRTIYDAVRGHFGHDGHFWLQYGVYELKFGHLDLAENYLLQAQGLIPQSEALTTAFGHLFMRQALETDSQVVAIDRKVEGEKILRAQIARIGMRDPYPYHVLGSQMLGYINRWVAQDEKAEELRRLHDEIKPGADRHGLAGYLRALLASIKKAELESVLGH